MALAGAMLVLASVAAAGAVAVATPHLDSLTAVCRRDRSLDLAAFAVAPLDVEAGRGSLFLLDGGSGVIWQLDRDGRVEATHAGPGAGCGRLDEPWDMFFGPDGRLWVADVGAPRLQALDLDTGAWEEISCGHNVFFGAADATHCYVNADRVRDPALVRASRPGVAGHVLLGEKLRAPPGPVSLRSNLNYVKLAAGEGLIVCGHVAVAHLQVLDRTGRRLAAIQVDTPEARAIRRWFWTGVHGREAPADSFGLAALTRDLARVAQPDRFPVPVYVADVIVRDGLIHVLCNNTILRYGRDGRLRERLLMPPDVVVLDLAILPDGRYCGVDTRHDLRAHVLSVPRRGGPPTTREESR